ncbi:MAG: hypothetical protein HBSIN02_11020 [Bacteroidia bacterium]|nr:MAG: hypothetical protein HBSIN02_11020 [Bacteroidia bacterium]
MHTKLSFHREPRALILGSLFVILGSSLLLDRLDVVMVRWDKFFWVAGLATGGFLVADGYTHVRRGRIYWGSVLLFFGAYQTLLRFDVIERYGIHTVPALFVVFGLAFLVLYLRFPSEWPLLIPFFILSGSGATFLLWWWEIVEWFEIRMFVRTYWPALLILIGIAMLFRRRPSAPSPTPHGAELQQGQSEEQPSVR